MKRVTDPSLLAELEGDSAVSDPALLAELEGGATPAAPATRGVPKWDDVKDQVPPELHQKTKNAISLAAAHDILPSAAMVLEAPYTKSAGESNLWDKAQGSLKAGVGDVYTGIGNALKQAGYSGDVTQSYVNYGERLRAAYIPPIDTSEFHWGKAKDPEWWATTVARGVPFTLSLVPAAVIGAYGGAGTAAATGVGAFGTAVLTGLGSAVPSRFFEAHLEAGGAYEEAKQRGMSEDQAISVGDETFKKNLSLVGVDAAQFALAFTPLRIVNGGSKLATRALAASVKIAGIGVSEGAEERFQETVQAGALGDDVSFFDASNPRLNEASAVGAVFGVGLGGAGSVWQLLTNRVKTGMPTDVQQDYDAAKTLALMDGKTDHAAEVAGLDAIAATPEGGAHIKETITGLKDAAEGRAEPAVADTATEPSVLETEDALLDELLADEEQEAALADEIFGEDTAEPTVADTAEPTVEDTTEPPVEDTAEPSVADTAESLADAPTPEQMAAEQELSASEDVIAGLSRDDLGGLIAKGDDSVLVHIRDGVVKYGAQAMEHIVRNQLVTEIARAAKGEARAAVRTQIALLEPMIDELFSQGRRAVAARSSGEIIQEINTVIGQQGAVGEGFNPTRIAPLLVEFGHSVWGEGVRTVEQFSARVKEATGKTWGEIKDFVQDVWEQVKRVNERLGQVGAVGRDIGRKEPVKTRIRRTTGQRDMTAPVSERTALRAAFTKAAQAARAALREGRTQEAAKAREEMRAAMQKVRGKQADADTRATLLRQLQNIKKKGMKSQAITLDYKRKIDELLDGLDFKKLSDAKRGQLEKLAEYLENEGAPLGIEPGNVAELRRLAKTPVADMATQDIQALKDQIKKLQALGRLKMRLLKFADARERQAKIEALAAGTVNLDNIAPRTRLQSKLNRSRSNTFKDLLQNVYMETLHTFRVTDMMDGFGRYKGPNTKLIRAQITASQDAQIAGRDRIQKAMDQITDLGLEELTEADQARVMIHIRFVERADDQVQTLAEQHGYTLPDTVRNSEELKAAVPLSPAEEKLIKIIQKIVTENVADVAALHEELTNTPFERIEGYVLPLLYERTGEIEPSSLVQQNFSEAGVKGGGPFRTKRTEQGFVKSRSVGVKKVPRIDVFGIMEEAINAQEWYLHVQPVLLDAAELVFSKEYQAQAGRVNSNWWRDQIDIMARRGWKSGVQSTPLSRGMQLVRGNLNRAVLLFKASTVMMQQFAVIDALAYAKAKLGNETAGQIAKEFVKTRVSPAYVEELVKKSKALQLRKGGEMAIEEVFTEAKRSDKWFARLEQAGGELVSRADMKVAAGVRQGILTVLEKNGLSGEEAAEEADFLMNISQGSADVAMRPHILGSSEGARTWFTFQNFFLNRWGLIAHDMIRGGAARGSFSERTNALLGLAVLMAGGLAEKEARDLLREFLGKKTTHKTNWIADLVAYVPEQVPFFGGMLENARRGFGTTEPPAVRALSGGVSGAVDVFRGKPVRGALKMGESALTVYWGVPGTAQLFDFLEVAVEDEKKKKRR